MTLESPPQNTVKNNILIVDDHPFIIQGYKNAIIRYNPKEYEFNISDAKDCRSAYTLITNRETPVFDIAFLDISMPAYDEKGIFSGEDVARLLKQYMPKCKIVLLTMYTESLRIKTIIDEINPYGLVIKNDLTFNEFLFGLDKVINNQVYYSQSIQKMMDQSLYEAIEIDLFDQKILFHISKGTKTEDLTSYIPISLNAIETRKLNLKKLLGIANGTDMELVQIAKDRGLLF
jgi:DNA-binding NarL/FixJ family response regulator